MSNIDIDCGSERTIELGDHAEVRLYCGLSEHEHRDETSGTPSHAVSQKVGDVWVAYMWPGDFVAITPAQEKSRAERA